MREIWIKVWKLSSIKAISRLVLNSVLFYNKLYRSVRIQGLGFCENEANTSGYEEKLGSQETEQGNIMIKGNIRETEYPITELTFGYYFEPAGLTDNPN